ncbi:MAG: hypothetical protein ACE365_05325 [Gammaproteobacteria bacterium]
MSRRFSKKSWQEKWVEELSESRDAIKRTGAVNYKSIESMQKEKPYYYAKLVESNYARDENNLFPTFNEVDAKNYHANFAGGQSNFETQMTRGWVCNAEHLKPGDTEPRVLCSSLGVEYNPSSNYELLIMKMPEDVDVYPADADGLSEVGDKWLGYDYDDYRSALDPQKQAEYRSFFENNKQVDLATSEERMFFTKEHAQCAEKMNDTDLLARTELHNSFGANEYYSGLGFTKSNNSIEGVDAGDRSLLVAREYFCIDKSPHTISELKSQDSILVVECKELDNAIVKLTSPDRELYERNRESLSIKDSVRLKENADSLELKKSFDFVNAHDYYSEELALHESRLVSNSNEAGVTQEHSNIAKEVKMPQEEIQNYENGESIFARGEGGAEYNQCKIEKNNVLEKNDAGDRSKQFGDWAETMAEEFQKMESQQHENNDAFGFEPAVESQTE